MSSYQIILLALMASAGLLLIASSLASMGLITKTLILSAQITAGITTALACSLGLLIHQLTTEAAKSTATLTEKIATLTAEAAESAATLTAQNTTLTEKIATLTGQNATLTNQMVFTQAASAAHARDTLRGKTIQSTLNEGLTLGIVEHVNKKLNKKHSGKGAIAARHALLIIHNLLFLGPERHEEAAQFIVAIFGSNKPKLSHETFQCANKIAAPSATEEFQLDLKNTKNTGAVAKLLSLISNQHSRHTELFKKTFRAYRKALVAAVLKIVQHRADLSQEPIMALLTTSFDALKRDDINLLIEINTIKQLLELELVAHTDGRTSPVAVHELSQYGLLRTHETS
jgi:hypothetical protein